MMIIKRVITKINRTPVLFLASMLLLLTTFESCQEPTPVITDPDLTEEIVGDYTGNYIVNFENSPGDNVSGQIILTVYKIDKTHVTIDTQGGDSFDCELEGTNANSVKLKNMANPKGIYVYGNSLTGSFSVGTSSKRLIYNVDGEFNGGSFDAEFTSLQ